jgi:hypothetical protein
LRFYYWHPIARGVKSLNQSNENLAAGFMSRTFGGILSNRTNEESEMTERVRPREPSSPESSSSASQSRVRGRPFERGNPGRPPDPKMERCGTAEAIQTAGVLLKKRQQKKKK